MHNNFKFSANITAGILLDVNLTLFTGCQLDTSLDVNLTLLNINTIKSKTHAQQFQVLSKYVNLTILLDANLTILLDVKLTFLLDVKLTLLLDDNLTFSLDANLTISLDVNPTLGLDAGQFLALEVADHLHPTPSRPVHFHRPARPAVRHYRDCEINFSVDSDAL